MAVNVSEVMALDELEADPLTFFVVGKPQTAGSKTQVPIIKGGAVVARRIVESGDRERKRTWRGDLRDAAYKSIDHDVNRLWSTDGAFEVRFVEVRKRPLGHLRTGRFAGEVKEQKIGARPTGPPDITKIARAAEDALKGVLWDDDALIVSERLDKVYADHVGLPPRSEGLIVSVRAARPYRGPSVRGSYTYGRAELQTGD